MALLVDGINEERQRFGHHKNQKAPLIFNERKGASTML
jgi:hypothetical protein